MTREFDSFIDRQLDALLPSETHELVVIEYADHWLLPNKLRACDVAALEFIHSWGAVSNSDLEKRAMQG